MKCSPLKRTAWTAALFSFLLPAPGPTAALEFSRGPYLVEASSVSVRLCWRREGAREDRCRTTQGLKPGAPFAYTVPGSTRSWTAKTLPPGAAPLHFAAFGDGGSGSDAQYRVAAVLKALDPDMLLLLGDIVYPRGEDEHMEQRYFAPYADTLPRFIFFPSPGNHDYGGGGLSQAKKEARLRSGYQKTFRRKKYYSFDAGPAHFISLDTNQAAGANAAEPLDRGSAQWDWLAADLARSTAAWKFVFMHVPLYASRPHGDHKGLRDAIEDLLVRHGVDMTFSGHQHYYERTEPIKGVVHIIAGGGGNRLREGKPKSWSKKLISSYGLVSVRVTPAKAVLEMLDDHGKVQDTLTLIK